MKTYHQLSLKHDSLCKRKFVFMFNSQSLIKCLVLLAGILAGSGFATQAQTTILNAPSTDVQITGKTYLETDFVSHLTKFEKGGFQVYGLRLLYGASKKLEVGTNLLYTRAAGSPQALEVQPNAKWQFYQNEEKGVAIAAGGVLYLPLPHHQTSDTLGLFYVT